MICFANKSPLVLGALSKSIATIVTQPLIVAKVGLQSKPPAARNGKPFKSFVEVMEFIVKNEGALSLFKGIGPQLLKGFLVQGILMMTKERYVAQTLHNIRQNEILICCITVSSLCLSSSCASFRSFGRSGSARPLLWLPRQRLHPRSLPSRRTLPFREPQKHVS